jgi:hypothetical protein
MYRPPPVRIENRSIFGGNVYQGVPNPKVIVRHGYPTRFRGPIYNTPQLGYRYQIRPYARSPFAGLGAVNTAGLTISPTGNQLADAAIGAAIGFMAGLDKREALVHAGVGAAAGGLLGLLGIAGIMGFELVKCRKACRVGS